MTEPKKLTMTEYARLNGLEIEELDGMPARFDGQLDLTDNQSCHISINRNLTSWPRSLVIGREIGYFAQEQRWPSMILDRPWKWEALATAREDIREFILRYEAEFRAEILMVHFTPRDEFRSYFKNKYLKSFPLGFLKHLLVQLLLVLYCVQTKVYKIFYILVLS